MDNLGHRFSQTYTDNNFLNLENLRPPARNASQREAGGSVSKKALLILFGGTHGRI